MRSVRFYQYGEPADVLRVEEAPTPAPGPGEALVRMRARPVNPSDLLTIRGVYPLPLTLPAVPGLEGMGVVEQHGPKTPAVSVGQRVIPLGVPGTWQEYLVVPVMRLLAVPDSLGDAAAAQFVVNPLTAWVMVTEVLDVQPGQWLLQTAAGSTLGRMVIQIARLRGFRTINAVRRREQVEELESLGADAVVCTADEDLPARVRELTEGAGVPFALDAVGGETGAVAVECLAPGGVLLVYGLLSGDPIPLESGAVLFRSLHVRGFWLSEWLRAAPPERREGAARELMRLMAQDRIRPPVEAEYDLGEVLAAVERAETPGRSGKVLLVG